MKRREPVYFRLGGAKGAKGGLRKMLGRKERLMRAASMSAWRRTKDGIKKAVYTVPRAGDGVLPLRLAKTSAAGTSGAGAVEYEFFLQSAWMTVLPGDDIAEQIYFSPHLKARYDARATAPCYLDYMTLPAKDFDVRAYTDWMEDEELYTGDQLTTLEVVLNKYNQGTSRFGKLMRCMQGSKTPYSEIMTLGEFQFSTSNSYILHVDADRDYWLVKITAANISRAKIIFQGNGDILHNLIKSNLGPGVRISQHSPLHAEFRRAEEYLFALVGGLGDWETIGSHSVKGAAPYGGWSGDWNGENVVHVTALRTPEHYSYVIDGIVWRLYHISVSDTASTSLVEEVLGTPDPRNMKIFHPVMLDVNRKMTYWYFMDKHQAYSAEVTSTFPVAAAYLEQSGQTGYFVIRYEFQKREYRESQSYGDAMDSAGISCGAGIVPTFSASGGITHAKDGFILDSPADEVSLPKEYYDGDSVYSVSITESPSYSIQACIVSASFLSFWDCTGGYDFDSLPNGCVISGTGGAHCKVHDVQYGSVSQIVDFSATRYRALHNALMFNAGGPFTFNMMSILYDRQTNRTITTRTDENGPISWSGGRTGYWWNRTPPCRLPPLWGGHITCDGAYDVPTGTTCPVGGGPVDVENLPDGYEVVVEHYLITPKRVELVLDEDALDWDDTGAYQDVYNLNIFGSPAYPYLEFSTWCREGVEYNYAGSGDFLDAGFSLDSIISDMSFPDPENHEGFLTIPVGGA